MSDNRLTKQEVADAGWWTGFAWVNIVAWLVGFLAVAGMWAFVIKPVFIDADADNVYSSRVVQQATRDGMLDDIAEIENARAKGNEAHVKAITAQVCADSNTLDPDQEANQNATFINEFVDENC